MQKIISAGIIVLLAIVAICAWQEGWTLAQLEAYAGQHSFAGAIACIGAFAASTILPISTLPLLPLAARIYGVWVTVLLTTAGWWLGCLAAFLIARWARAFLERVTSLETIRRLESKLPADVGFGGIVTLRIVFPGDIAGIALGLLKHVRFSTFAVASLIGTIPGAIVFSYAGAELGKGQFASCALLLIAMVLGTILLQRVWPERSRASLDPESAVPRRHRVTSSTRSR